MQTKQLLIVIILLFFVLSCKSTGTIRKTAQSIELKEFKGISQYKKGNYEQAFHLLKEPAAWGYKGSQYALAFMFLKGQYVQQSTLLGMGWLGVAIESGVKEWSDHYNNFYAAASDKKKLEIDMIVKEYIKRYGLKSQHVTCSKGINSIKLTSVQCHKYETLSILYPVDMVE
jgi:hypothetical protein